MFDGPEPAPPRPEDYADWKFANAAPDGRGLHSFTLELNLSNSRTR
jgi:hypothetical protein